MYDFMGLRHPALYPSLPLLPSTVVQNPFPILQCGVGGSNMLGWSTGGGTKTQAATEPTHDDGVVLR